MRGRLEHECVRPGCSVRFKHRSGKNANKYCSRSCAFADQDAWNNSTRAGSIKRRCQGCAETYLRASSTARFPNTHCSEVCEAVALQGRLCSICGGAFDTEHLGEVTCSESCKREVEYRASAKRHGSIGRRRYRPRDRMKKLCLTCSKPFVGDSGHRYCSRQCRPSFKRRRKGEASRHLPYLVVRDGGRCQLCRRKVNLTATVPHPRAPVVDHIVPRSRGGGDGRANLQLAHWLCNSKKGARGCGSQLRLLG